MIKQTILAISVATMSTVALADPLINEVSPDTLNAAGSASQFNINSPLLPPQPEQRAVTRNVVDYAGEYKLKNVPNVNAPALTTTMTETCMGSTSAGGAVAGFGLSFGTTWRDSACVRRLDARELNSLGYRLGAKELMCDSENVRAALLRANTPCREDIAELPPVAPVIAPAEEAPARGYNSFLDNHHSW